MKTIKNNLGTIALRAALAAVLWAMANFQNAHADIIPVTSTADDGGPATLRGALAAALDGDVIDATAIAGTITLLPNSLTSSQLIVAKSVTILGPGPASLTIDGNQTSRVLRILPGLNVAIEGFTI